MSHHVSHSRRAVLGLLGATATGGCVSQFQSSVSRDDLVQLSLTIKTVPADADATATRLAQNLATRLQDVGIDASVMPMSREELRRAILLNHEFDIYVYRFHRPPDPDFMRPMLHSRFATGYGWQNPFGYGNLGLDDALTRQSGERGRTRRQTFASIERTVVQDQPFTVVGFPDAIRTTRRDSVVWLEAPIHSVSGYLTAQPVHEEYVTDPRQSPGGRLRMALTDSRPTENLNPLSMPFRRSGVFIDLVYDSLARWVDDEIVPWLARSWSWERHGGSTVTVRLRDGLRWHDGEPLTAEDVVFTYRFLTDTTMGRADEPVPSPSYRGRASLVEDAWAVDSRTVSVSFGDHVPEVAARALTVPVLPAHVWSSYTDPVNLAGLDVGTATKALVHQNLTPVGSGPLRVTGATPRKSLRLEPNEDHFLGRSSLPAHLRRFDGGFAFDELTFFVVPSDGAAVGLVATGDLDATATPIAPDTIRRVAGDDALDLWLERSSWCYHVGYNHRRPPFTNPRFRRAVARLVDRDHLVESVFDGYATPATTPLAGTPYAAPDRDREGTRAALSFAGMGGKLDVERARDLFADAGYTYSVSGDLLVQR